MPKPKGLYHPDFERDSCGVALVAQLGGGPSTDVLSKALEALGRMAHRGAVGADAGTGDGAGVLLQIPHGLYAAWAEARGLALPEPGRYAVATCFLPRDAPARRASEGALERASRHYGLVPLGWRDVEVDERALGASARASRPAVRQLFVACHDGDGLARTLLLARKRAARLAAPADFYVASFSARTVVYKGLLRAERVGAFYPELADPRVATRFAVVHARFSTNTFPSWARAQPLRGLAHNGEINTLRGNLAWMRAREGRFDVAGPFRDRGEDLLPVLEPGGSDSAALDNAVELLVAAGVPVARALMMLVPAATEGRGVPREVREFYEYHARLTEPWDGPAALCFTDGRLAGAALDRNGLRPLRYCRTEGGLVVVASEAGAVDLGGARVVARGRLGPGGILLVDPEKGLLLCDDEVKAPLAAERPYGRLVEATRARLVPPPAPEGAPAAPAPAGSPSTPAAPAPAGAAGAPAAPAARTPAAGDELLSRLRLFGYTHEDVTLVLAPMAQGGEEPVGSMGADVALAALSEKPQLLFRYFKQHFAQVTNPPIDPVREASVLSLRTFLGPELAWFEGCVGKSLELEQPVLTPEALDALAHVDRPGWRVETLEALFEPGDDPGRALGAALEGLVASACRAVARGAQIVVLSDRDAGPGRAPLPSLLAVGAVHHGLVRAGLRSLASLVVDAGDAREVAHLALLVGYGASALCPRLAFDAIDDLAARGALGAVDAGKARQNYVKALTKGLAKVIAKMGVSTLAGYQGAQVFEAVGLDGALVDRYFEGTPSRLGGVGLGEIALDAARRFRDAFDQGPAEARLPPGGLHYFRVEGERHLWTPEGVASLQRSVRLGDQDAYDRFAAAINDPGDHPTTLRGLWALAPAGPPLAPERVEPVASLFRRFATGAMSFGSISREAHETLALAMNRAGGRSNSGEGGEDEARYVPGPDGSSRRSAIKQVASGRFGVTAHYLVNADELQIKIAQGAKPGEGGQLPGHKVDRVIARVRHSVPGVTLISPPPHHDIYSIEDLAQLIFDLKRVNPRARVSVKLVAEAGVGAVAAGVAKAGADAILISGHDGGTGAAPLSSIHHAGLPWELGLAEAHQVLVLNGLRGRVRLQVDGQLRTGRDVVIAALLGAEEFGFATAPLVAVGCVLMRKCHLNTCPVGIATQDPALRRRFEGTPEHVLRYFGFVAEEARAWLARLGLAGIDEAVGRVDLLRRREGLGPRASRLDTAPLLTPPDAPPGAASRLCEGQPPPAPGADLALVDDAREALEGRGPVRLRRRIGNVDRAYGTALSGEVARRHGPSGLPDDTIAVELEGCAGQSFGAFLARGVTLSLEGEANDYVGKGLSGGVIALRLKPGEPEGHAIAGNTLLYGATSGRAFLRGRAGERFAVRNSGASAVVEGVGDHGCEYMTGGAVAVLGPVGHNFGAGMSGGVAYLLRDALPEADRARCLHSDALAGLDESLDEADARRLGDLLREHALRTDSPAARRLLEGWPAAAARFVKIVPPEYRRALEADHATVPPEPDPAARFEPEPPARPEPTTLPLVGSAPGVRKLHEVARG
ncbi:MAG TPA: glutamate synthase large subunit [Polyangiaceae bacterium]|nr:glutamate synthase large subunit [Polyangiaceae bacterium]